MEIRTALTGPFPRSEALVAATRDLDRGRTTPDLVEALYRSSEAEVAELEERLGLDVLSGGYLAWPDLFRPFAERWRGFTVGPVTRWFETNTFYRQPILHAPPERVEGAVVEHLPPSARSAPAKAKVTLPGPYTFVGLLDNRSGETFEGLTHRLGRLLAEEVRGLHRLGYRTFQFQEPLLVTDPPEGPRGEAVVAAYRAIAEAAAGSTILLWTFFGDAAPLVPFFDRLPVSAVGVDLAETEPSKLPAPNRLRGLGLGCLDPRTSLVEDASEVARIARDLRRAWHPSTLWLGPGAPLDLLPTHVAARKLHLLPAAKALLGADGEAA
ncbi:MAG TPA: hypothetical protein VGV64_08445 [Thermoplasmata archaeon]|nr:hypothetical protein [Thermoplasmata archaeon]HEV2429851.1 hypothetical protein [Thermoplasmata archaeon]